MKRIKMNDPEAFFTLGQQYSLGEWGLSKDINKALELWQKAAELGLCKAHAALAETYHIIEGVEKDLEKFILHLELAAIGGHEHARYTLGTVELQKGNNNKAMKHFIIAARSGRR
jgi:TPR repeat protein